MSKKYIICKNKGLKKGIEKSVILCKNCQTFKLIHGEDYPYYECHHPSNIQIVDSGKEFFNGKKGYTLIESPKEKNKNNSCELFVFERNFLKRWSNNHQVDDSRA